MQLGYIIIYVENVKETVLFYEKAFGLKHRFIDETNAYAEMETGQTALAFFSKAMAKTSHSFLANRIQKETAGFEIALVVDNVEEKYKHAIKEGALPVAKPVKKPWGQIVSYVKDNNGCLVEICSPIKNEK